ESPTLIGFTDSQLHEIVDFDGLMQRLRENAVDHPLKPVLQAPAQPATAEDFDPVATEVARFVNDPEYVSLTMTIRFTAAGLSLGRQPRGHEMHFFAHPRRDPEEDSRILSLLRASAFSRSWTTSAIVAEHASFTFRSRARA